jgi:hypothetical protein
LVCGVSSMRDRNSERSAVSRVAIVVDTSAAKT